MSEETDVRPPRRRGVKTPSTPEPSPDPREPIWTHAPLLRALLGAKEGRPAPVDRPAYRRLVRWIAQNCQQVKAESGDLPSGPEVVDLCSRAFEPYQPLGLWSVLRHARPHRVQGLAAAMVEDEALVSMSAVAFLSELAFHVLLDEVDEEIRRLAPLGKDRKPARRPRRASDLSS